MRLPKDVRASARSLIAQRLGLDFPEQRDDDLERRLLRAWPASEAASTTSQVNQLAKLPLDSPEWKQLVGHLTVGETYFFRDRGSFEALEQQVLPRLIERRREEGTRRLRIWSAACSSGEEPYSLAMLIDRLLPDRSDWSVTILATDLNPYALAVAREARYRERSLRETPEELVRTYFRPRGVGVFELVPSIRRMVAFAPLNLAEEVYPSLATNTSAMDLILCRNAIMYFTREAQQKTVRRLQQALVEEGWLGLSPAEASAELLRPLEPVNFPGAILFRKSANRPAAPAPTPPSRRVAQPPTPARRRPEHRSVVSAPSRRSTPPSDRAGLVERARGEADRGNLDLARDLCREAIAGDALDFEARVLLAAIQQERGDIADAIDAVRSAIYLSPDSPSAHFVLGNLLLRQGQTEKARRSMETVVSLLDSVPAEQQLDGAEGVAAGRLRETARAYLEAR